MDNQTIERKFDVSGTALLRLANISGSVDIRPGEDGAISVTAIKGTQGDVEHTRIEMEQAADGSVMVKTEYGDSFWRWFGQRPCDVNYSVRIPAHCTLQVRSVSSQVMVKGLTGEFEFNSVSGNVQVADLAGNVKINMVSGGLSGEHLSGPTEVEAVSGKVDLLSCNFESLKLSTVSGRVNLETPLLSGPYRLHSISGDVRLVLPGDAHCAIDFTSLSGNVISNLAMTYSDKSSRHRHLEFQGGGMAIAFDSISGNLEISAPQGQNAAPAVPNQKNLGTPVDLPVAPPMPAEAGDTPTPPAAPDINQGDIDAAASQRQAILDRVARGELSVEQAVDLLRG